MKTVSLQLDIRFTEGIKEIDAEIVREIIEFDLKHCWGLGHYDLGNNEVAACELKVREKSEV